MSRSQWYIGAPNGVILCINETAGGSPGGLLYHSYRRTPIPFSNLDQAVFHMEALYDYLRFPHPSTNERSFAEPKKQAQLTAERKKVMNDDDLLQKHGDIGTFIVRVQHRQNSSWQGRITWMENDKTVYFRSIWEMIKLIESAVDTVSAPEDGEFSPSWVVEEEK